MLKGLLLALVLALIPTVKISAGAAVPQEGLAHLWCTSGHWTLWNWD